MTEDSRFEALVCALPDGHPDPADVRESELFDSLDNRLKQAEREGPKSVDWPGVVRDAFTLLTTQSHDMTVACWLACALARAEGTAGLALGIMAVGHMVEHEWESAYPPLARIRQRRGILGWLATQLSRVVPEAPIPPGDEEAVLRAYDALNALDRQLDQVLPDAPSLRDVLGPLKILARDIRADREAAAASAVAEPAPSAPPAVEDNAPVEAPPPPPPPPPPPEPVVVPPPVNVAPQVPTPAAPRAPVHTPEPVVLDENAEAALHVFLTQNRSFALSLLERDPLNWQAWTVLLGGGWASLTFVPPADATGVTQIMPPATTRLDEFQALEQAGQWSELIQQLASFCSASGLFWLDGHYRMAQALTRLDQGGERGRMCAQSVQGAAQAGVARLSGLEQLSFQNGMVFASPATRQWLRPAAASAPAGAVQGDDPVSMAWAAAAECLQSGDVIAAVAKLGRSIGQAGSARDRFRLRLRLAGLLLDAKAGILAEALLAHLVDNARGLGLVEWEPALSSDLQLLRHRCAMSAEPATMPGDNARQALAELVLTDPAAALGLLQGRNGA